MPALKYIKVLLKICSGPKTAIVFRRSALKYFLTFFVSQNVDKKEKVYGDMQTEG